MESEERESKITEMGIKLTNLMQMIDMFAMDVERDIDLLEETKTHIADKISHNESAMVIITALGGTYDSTEDKCKLKTMDLLIELIKTRIELKQEKIKQSQRKTNNQNILKQLFGI